MKHTIETRRQCAKIRRGRRHSEESKRRISLALRTRHQRYGPARRYDLQPASLRIPHGAELGYLAGIIDGEGSIRFRAGRPFLAVYNTSTELMDWLFNMTGRAGRITDRRGRVPCYTWQVAGTADLVNILLVLKPFLVVKRADAEQVMDYLANKYPAVLHG